MRTSTGHRTSPGGFAAGVDAGGTRIRVEVRGDGRVRHRELPAVSVAGLPGLLGHVWRAWHLSPRIVGALVVASRGIWTPAECRRVARTLRGLARRVRVISDAEAAFEGALGGGAGVLVLAGTGSIVVGHNGAGSWRRAGGFGPLLGDEGSAFWIGREWLRGRSGAGDFARVRAFAHDPAPVARIAALAPRVLARARGRDPLAGRIARDAQRHLARLALACARSLRLRRPIRMSWAGSLLVKDPWFRAGLIREITRQGGRAAWIVPREPPVTAAARLAEAMLDRGRGRTALEDSGFGIGDRAEATLGRGRARTGRATRVASRVG